MTKHDTRSRSTRASSGSLEAAQNAPGLPAPVDEQDAMSLMQTPNAHRPAIVVRNLSKAFQHKNARIPVLRDLSFQVQRGEFVALTGPTGAGKSALLHVLGCITQLSQGDYWLAAKTMSRMRADELADVRNQYIGFVSEGPALLPGVSALDNVALPLLYAGFSRTVQERRARTLLQLVGLGTRLQQRPAQLSLWQQQRVALARALVNNPFLLLADEPAASLDTRSRLEVMAFLQALNQRGLTIVLATREADIAHYAKRLLTLQDGRVVHDTPVNVRRIAIDELAKGGYGDPGSGDISERETLRIQIQEELS